MRSAKDKNMVLVTAGTPLPGSQTLEFVDSGAGHRERIYFCQTPKLEENYRNVRHKVSQRSVNRIEILGNINFQVGHVNVGATKNTNAENLSLVVMPCKARLSESRNDRQETMMHHLTGGGGGVHVGSIRAEPEASLFDEELGGASTEAMSVKVAFQKSIKNVVRGR